MKKHVIMAAICGSFTLFTACSGHSKEESSDSSATTQDSAGVNTGAGAGTSVDSGAATVAHPRLAQQPVIPAPTSAIPLHRVQPLKSK